MVTYIETIQKESTEFIENVLVKTGNKHNRFFGTSMVLDEQLVKEIEKGEISMKTEVKERNKRLTEEFNWDKTDAVKLWCFGPEEKGPNVLVDTTKAVQSMNEIKDNMISAFQQATRHGALAEEQVRGVRFNICDAHIHPDPAHRKQGQVMPAARRLYQGLQLFSKPTLLEPVFACEITVPQEATGGVYQTLNARRGLILEEDIIEGTPLKLIKAELPVVESFGFVGALRGNTQGKAFPQCFFDHWQPIKGDPYED